MKSKKKKKKSSTYISRLFSHFFNAALTKHLDSRSLPSLEQEVLPLKVTIIMTIILSPVLLLSSLDDMILKTLKSKNELTPAPAKYIPNALALSVHEA